MVCERIPKIVEMSDYADYQSYEDAIYLLFKRDFIDNTPTFKSYPIQSKHLPYYKNKSGTFWHIIATGKTEESKLPDIRRYERIQYPAFIINYCSSSCNSTMIWRNNRKGKDRILIYCREIRYLVVLEDRKKYLLFWTSYPITREHTHNKLLKEYSAYIKTHR